MYKTQYYLSVKSENGINTYDNNGTGWYDAGDLAQFAANTFGSVTSLYSFDHWNGTISLGQSHCKLWCFNDEWAKSNYRSMEI